MTTSDDAFREIQLSGKPLVFLFIAATVVSIVIFLCGVLVGRGVRVERAMLAQAETPLEPVADRTPSFQASTPAGADPTAAQPPPPPVDELTYFTQLESPDRAAALLQPSVEASPAVEIAPDRPAVQRTVAPARTPAAAEPSGASAPGAGYAVQVAALNVRSEADAIARRLSAKGYAAYVQVPSGAPSVFRVRVGAFKTRREADAVAARLQKEEQFKPWVTR